MWNWECGYTMRVGILQVWLSYDEGCLKVSIPYIKISRILSPNTHCECVSGEVRNPLNLLVHRGVFRHHREN